MRLWLPLDETPAWSGSRPVQLVLLVCIAFGVAGVVAACVVQVDSPGTRVIGIAAMTPGLLTLVVLLVRSQRIRWHHAGSPGEDRVTGPRS